MPALTDESVGRLPKDDRVVVFGDADEDGAGYKQANRLRDHLVGLGYTAHVVDMAKLHPEGKPPAGFDARDWTATLAPGTTSVQAQEVILEAVVDRHAAFEPEARPDTVDAAVEALTGGGRRGVPDRLDELVVAVTAAELTGTRLTAVRAAALAQLTAGRFMLAPEARAMLNEGFKSDDDDEKRPGRKKEWPEVEPAERAVPLAQILDQLVDQLRRFLHLPGGAAETIATWIAWTYVEPHSYILPTLAIASPTKGCGKTLLLDVISVFVERPFDTSTVTPAAIFRIVEEAHPVLLLDEADRWMKQDATGEKTAILNAGHRRGGSASLCVQVGDDWQTRQFAVDAPRAIAGIGDFMPDTLADRSVIVTLEKKPAGVRLASFRADRHPAPELQGQLKRWAADEGRRFAAHDPAMGNVVNREADNWRVLYGVADMAGPEWSTRIRGAADEVRGRAAERTTKESYPEMLLMDCREVFNNRGGDRIVSRELDAALRALDDRPWDTMRSGKGLTPQARGRWLDSFGINSTKLEPEHLQGYERAAFEAAWESYASPSQIEPGEPGELGCVDSIHPGSPSSPGSIQEGQHVHPEPGWVMKGDETTPRDPLHTPPSELTVDQIGELAGPSSALDGFPETVTDLERFTTMDGRNLDELALKRRHPSNLQLVSVESMAKWLTVHRGLSREQALLSIQARAVRFLNGEERES